MKQGNRKCIGRLVRVKDGKLVTVRRIFTIDDSDKGISLYVACLDA